MRIQEKKNLEKRNGKTKLWRGNRNRKYKKFVKKNFSAVQIEWVEIISFIVEKKITFINYHTIVDRSSLRKLLATTNRSSPRRRKKKIFSYFSRLNYSYKCKRRQIKRKKYVPLLKKIRF